MLHFPKTMPPPTNARPLPQRTYSVNAVKNANFFSSVDEELRDCKRAQRQGQEEDLREALSRVMARMEEMCAMLKSSYQTNTDLETQLTLAQSNLKLALANNEMLEDALKSSSLPKDVGWRRSSREPGASSPLPPFASQRTSIDEGDERADSPGTDRDSRAQSPSPAPLPVPTAQSESGFFRFRFSGSGRSTPTQPPNSPPRSSRPLRASHPAAGHLTSASLPSLVAPTTNHELEELRGQLVVEKRNSEKIAHEKKELEGELESLSQALFEEANKMVAMERIKRAEAEDELKEVHAEKEALKSALRLIEEERLRAESAYSRVNGTVASSHALTNGHSRSSSREAIVSPRPRTDSGSSLRDESRPPSPPPPSAQSQSQSPIAISTNIQVLEPDADADEVPSSPAPLYVPPPHLADSAPASRTGSPMPLPHPHRPSHLRPTGPPPAPPPPSAADGFPDSPWARPPSGEDTEPEVPHIVAPYTPPPADEMATPWGKW
ncbi:hypothetical protein BC834DRAFT_1026547 [Gloeopeniophorella convolvens]|nr:hypothetical protein BC834DRAFT_1026547 [Gloeopeniophorella convolvens]